MVTNSDSSFPYKDPVVIWTLGSLALFFCLTVFISFPFVADDYHILHESYQSGFTLSVFNPFVERMPLTMGINLLLFKYHLWERTWSFMYLFYFFHALGFSLILKWLIISLAPANAKPRPYASTGSRKLFTALVAVLCFHPNLFEVVYWPMAAPYTFGLLLLAIGLYQKNYWLKAIFLSSSFLVSEMFFMISLVLLILPTIEFDQFRAVKFGRLLRIILPWLASVGLYVSCRLLLEQYFPRNVYQVNLSLQNVISQFGYYLRMVYDIQFFRLNWVATVLEWLATIILVTALLREKLVHVYTVLLVFSALTLSCINNLFLKYDAARAYYGTISFKGLLLLTFAYPLFLSVGRYRTKVAVVSLFATAYLVGNGTVLFIKHRNSNALKAVESEIEAQFAACNTDCKIRIKHPSSAVKGDWVLPIQTEIDFVRWVEDRLQNGKTATVEFY